MAAAHRVMNGERLSIPNNCPKVLVDVMTSCWNMSPDIRPDFGKIIEILNSVSIEEQEIRVDTPYNVVQIDNPNPPNSTNYNLIK